jgi:cell wall-associated NlpC family hydrolase
VQTALAATGHAAPRDSDQQAASLGGPVEGGVEGNLARGDLVFWKGHVGILRDATTLLHASGHHMAVVAEPLSEALSRYAGLGIAPIGVRRLD